MNKTCLHQYVTPMFMSGAEVVLFEYYTYKMKCMFTHLVVDVIKNSALREKKCCVVKKLLSKM